MAIFNMVGGGGSFSATISVTNATASATVTATSGSDVFTATATSSGTATITVTIKGNYILTCTDKYSPSAVSVTTMGATYSVRMLSVPTTYQEVEYLQSTGTQYIDTGISIANNEKFEVNVAFTSTAFQQFGAIRVVSSVNQRFHFGIYESKFDLFLTSDEYPLSTADSNYHVISRWNTSTAHCGSFDGTNYSYTTSISFPSATFYLMARNGVESGAVSTKCSCMLKSFTHSNLSSGEILHNFIPCYRISDSVAGMYDTVNDVFYDNDGTGTFVVGGDVA